MEKKNAMTAVFEWMGFPSFPRMLKSYMEPSEQKNELSGSQSAAVETVSIAALILPLLWMIMWIVSVALTAMGMSKLNAGIARNRLSGLSAADADMLPKLGTASSFLWMSPFVNIILSSIFMHKVRMAKL